MTSPKSLQFWSGQFGNDYTDRNSASLEAVRGRVRAWAQIFKAFGNDLPKSVLEIGPNVGMNLRALPAFFGPELYAIEPNAKARRVLIEDGVLPEAHLIEGFGHNIPLGDGAVELSFTSGVLIHVDPTLLDKTLDEIHRVSSKYIVCIEYFSPKPEVITYRDEQDLLFKNDFGGLYLDRFSDLELVDYGFFWKRMTSIDDANWWLFKKLHGR
jgi:spore coat polysaccharide biosynthesis protein SpsF